MLLHPGLVKHSSSKACYCRLHLLCVLQPKNYLDFITKYKTSLTGHRKEITDTSSRLSNGLAKLVQASAEVDVLQKELSQAKVVVEAATQGCNQLLEVSGQWRLCILGPTKAGRQAGSVVLVFHLRL
jgi:hypothetical protein